MENKYTCGVCKKVRECDDTLPEIKDDEIFLCPSCQEVIHRLTGIKFDEEVDENV